LGEYERCAVRLGLRTPDVEPRATQEMAGIIEMISGLVDEDVAYETADGVYFCVKCFPAYGQLSNRDIEELRAGERVAVNERKEDPLDFALWKKAKPGEPTWDSPWGPGRPGWHIECSAMARRYLGDQIDIHGGAADLIFPHHENEVAQSETFSHKHPMANFWVHGGLLMVDGHKMSKTVGNFTPLEEMLNRYPAAAIRYLFLQTGYRKPINFTEDSIDGATKGLRGLYADLDALRAAGQPSGHVVGPANAGLSVAEFDEFLNDDFNTAGAVGWLRTRIRDARSNITDTSADRAAIALAERCLQTFGLPLTAESAGVTASERGVELSQEARVALRQAVGSDAVPDDDVKLIERVVSLLDEARAQRNYARSDSLRSALTKAGIAVRNTPGGTEWSVGDAR
jgi:cysteinyl-tRNA synthetase